MMKTIAEKKLEEARATSESAGGTGRFVSLFDGKTLKGWHLRNSDGPSCWSVGRGELIGVGQGRNDLISDQVFQDFELHLEFLLAPKGDTGVYLRGRYQLQLMDAVRGRPDENTGAIFGLIAPARQMYLGPGKWNSLDVRLIGRNVTVVMNGERIIDDKYMAHATVGSLDNFEDQPGPVLLQSWEGEFRFRNIRIHPLKAKSG